MNTHILFWLAVLFDVARSECPPPYEAVGSECFLLCPINTDWMTAQAKCRVLGGDLAVPSNVANLYEFVISKIGKRPVWIGGTDLAVEGDWHSFINGQPINPGDFHPSAPDNMGGSEDCLELGYNTEPLLNDNECHNRQFSVCEVDPCSSDHLMCEPPFTLVNGECFYVGTHAAEWELARWICHFLGGDLAVPDDLSSFMDFVGDHSVWIGGADVETEGDWFYVDGSGIASTHWHPGQPNNFEGNEDCLYFSHDETPPLFDKRCTNYEKFVCEIPPVCGGNRTAMLD